MHKDSVTLIKALTGEEYKNLKVRVGVDKIYTRWTVPAVKSGDTFLRHLPNKEIEKYLVINPIYYPRRTHTPSRYEIVFQKLELIELILESNPKNFTIINGNHNQVNNQSFDNSLNIENSRSEINSLIELLRQEIERSSHLESEKSEALDLVKELVEQANSSKPKPHLIKAIIRALPLIDNVQSIGGTIFTMIQSLPQA